jgi:hypothetical protein
MKNRIEILCLVALACASCALPVEGVDGAELEGEELGIEEDVAVTQQAITNGGTIDANESGVVALQVWSTTLARYYTFCTGSLITNSAVLTAKHCLEGDGIETRTVYVKMGSQRKTVNRRYLHGTQDVALVKTSGAFTMPNWTWDHFSTYPAQRNNFEYGRGGYMGTNMSLKNQTVNCYGYGGDTGAEPRLSAASFKVRVYGPNEPAMNPRDQIQLLRTSSNQLHEPGDSGGPCVIPGWPIYTQLVVSVLSGCFDSLDFCYGHGAQDWRDWAAIALISP